MNLMRPFLSRRDAIKTGTAAALGLLFPIEPRHK
jgi:hypothetical protein